MKKVDIGLIILFLVIGSISIYYFTSKGNKETKTVLDTVNVESEDDSSKKEDNTDDPVTKINENDSSSDKNVSNNDVSSNKSNLESNNATNTNVINKETKQTNVEQEKPKEEVKTSNSEPSQEPKVEQHQPTAWESLGISEYDYYNKPMWSWARIDYSVKTYGNFEQTHQACIDAGNSMEDIVSFSCTNINSYSGDYLGDMLRVKY